MRTRHRPLQLRMLGRTQRRAEQAIRMERPVAFLLVLASCEGRSELQQLAPAPITSEYRHTAHCSDPVFVTAGTTVLGELEVRGEKGLPEARESWTVSLGDCRDWAGWAPARALMVYGFYLDVDEVSASCYDDCVAVGECVPRTLGEAAGASAYLDQSMTEAFCSFRGGRLPTAAELSRAANGGELSLGPPTMFDLWTHCMDHRTASWNAPCQDLASRNLPSLFDRHDHLLRAEERDVGPFGHYDLFGGLAERTVSRLGDSKSAADWCGPEHMDDPGTFGTGPRVVFQPALLMGQDSYTLGDTYFWFEQRGLLHEDAFVDPEQAPILGARCAYDAAPGEP